MVKVNMATGKNEKVKNNCPKKKVKADSKNEESNGSNIGYVIMLIACCVPFIFIFRACTYVTEPHGISNATFRDTDGYEIEVYTTGCKLRKDGKLLSNICRYDENASGSGLGKLEICDSFGTDCESLTIYDHSYDTIYIYGRVWNKQ